LVPDSNTHPTQRRLLKILVIALGAYLAMGMAFALLTMPEQSWSCTNPDRPGEDFGGGGPEWRSPKEWKCTPDVDMWDRVEWFGFGTVYGPVLFTLKALSEHAELCAEVSDSCPG
jgi:hypothetical protein